MENWELFIIFFIFVLLGAIPGTMLGLFAGRWFVRKWIKGLGQNQR